MTSESKNIKTSKSKVAIHDAFISILEYKSIDKISVKEISEKAGINRKTFYAHYTCIKDIANEIKEELVEGADDFLKSIIIDEYGFGPQYFLQFINMIYSSNPSFFENLITGENYHFLVESCKKSLKERLLEGLNLEDGERLKADFSIEFALGGASAIYVEWIKNQKPIPFEEVSSLILDMILSGIPG